jgi:hypothetical protein
MNLNYIITETVIPDSFDPLLADKSNNILMMRMLYFTPIQINSANELISNVLEKFEYNPQTFTITLTPKKKIGTFSDGTGIDKKDVLVAILRMAYSMPNFPVIKDIVGVHEWSDRKQGISELPLGIISSETEIQIRLTRHNPNALFRFCLELFSIIPSRCIDLHTGKLLCNQPPSSGYYELETKNEKSYSFKLRTSIDNHAEKIQYKTIQFQYKNIAEICSLRISANTIIAGTDLGFSSSKCPQLFKQEQIHWLQASRFGAVLFNPNIAPFNEAKNRRFFLNQVRSYMEDNYNNLIIETSLFTKLLPGYLNNSQFEKDHFNPKELGQFKGKNFYVPKFSQAIHTQTVESVKQVAKNLEMNIVELDNSSIEFINKFLNNEASFMIGSSGFWAQDPIGDLSMFFSKNLHKALKFLWEDKGMYDLIKNIENEQNPLALKTKMEIFNRYLYEQSLFGPLIHFRRLYITHESIKSLNLPMAVTSPAPWHLVPTE